MRSAIAALAAVGVSAEWQTDSAKSTNLDIAPVPKVYSVQTEVGGGKSGVDLHPVFGLKTSGGVHVAVGKGLEGEGNSNTE